MKDISKKLDREKILLFFTMFFIFAVILYKITLWDQISKNSDEYKFAEYLYSWNISKIPADQTPFDRYMTNYETALLLYRLQKKNFFTWYNETTGTHDCAHFNFSGFDASKTEILQSCESWFFDYFSGNSLTGTVTEKEFINSIGRLIFNSKNKTFDEIYDYLINHKVLDYDLR